MRKLKEVKRLLKVRVDYQDQNQWYLKPECDRKGNSVSMGHRIFRGDDDAFRKYLIKLKVSDVDSEPASYRSTKYADIVQNMKQHKRTYIWMYSNVWSPTNAISESIIYSEGTIDEYLSGEEDYVLDRTSTKGTNIAGRLRVLIGERSTSIFIYKLDQNRYAAYYIDKETNQQYKGKGSNPKLAFMTLLKVLKNAGYK